MICSTFPAKQPLTMEQKFGKNSIDIEALREFCEREGKEVTYRKGDQLERERLRVGELAREWATPHGGSASSPKGASSM